MHVMKRVLGEAWTGFLNYIAQCFFFSLGCSSYSFSLAYTSFNSFHPPLPILPTSLKAVVLLFTLYSTLRYEIIKTKRECTCGCPKERETGGMAYLKR